MFIVTNISYVSVYLLESKYSFIWLWASKSPAKIYQFYYIAFLLNTLMCVAALSIPISLSTLLKKIISRYFWFFIIPISILIMRALAGFVIFDLELYPFGSSDCVEKINISPDYYKAIYCEYWNFGVDSKYSDPQLCDRRN